MISLKTAFVAVLGTALLSAPANAGEPEVTEAVKKLEHAVKKLESVEQSLTDYKLSNAAAVRQLQVDVEALKEDVRFLRQMIANPGTTSKREAFDTAPKMGRVKLMNEFVEEMSVVVNGTSYRLLPGQSRTINVMPGIFTYQVLQLQRSPQERRIAADEEKPIRIFTQR